MKELVLSHVSHLYVYICSASTLSLPHWHHTHISLCLLRLTVWCIFFGFLLLRLANVTVFQQCSVFVWCIFFGFLLLRLANVIVFQQCSVFKVLPFSLNHFYCLHKLKTWLLSELPVPPVAGCTAMTGCVYTNNWVSVKIACAKFNSRHDSSSSGQGLVCVCVCLSYILIFTFSWVYFVVQVCNGAVLLQVKLDLTGMYIKQWWSILIRARYMWKSDFQTAKSFLDSSL